MAATLASVCSVPLTSVLLLFELTRDYRILLPLMVSFLLTSKILFEIFMLSYNAARFKYKISSLVLSFGCEFCLLGLMWY